MKRYTFITLALCASLSAGLTACNDMLTEDPDSSYKKEKFFSSEANAQLAVTGIFDVLSITSHYGGNETVMPCSDDTYYMQGTNSDNIRRDIAHYTVNATNTWLRELWDHKYTGIDRANYAIRGIEGMAEYSEEDKKLVNLVAQAHFLRAFLAFDLIKYWGDVPFKTTPTEKYDEAFGPRVGRELIYNQIIEDLNFAKEKLEWATASSSPESLTQGAARAMLMRVLMQRAGYSLQTDGTLTRPDDATRAKYFEAVLEEYKEFMKVGYHNFYPQGYTEMMKSFSAGTLNSKESIWEIAFYTPNGNLGDASTYGTYIGPLVAEPKVKPTEKGNFMGRANAFYRVVPEWKEFFEETDQRRDVMVCTYQYKWDATLYNHVKVENKAGKDWYPGKWRREWMPLGYIDLNNVNVNFCPLRYADVMLMAAEAYNETNQSTLAWEVINDVRSRAGATPITAANYNALLKAPKVLNLPFLPDGDEKGRIRTALYWERGFELAFEGQRKYDLIRWGVLGEALTLMGKHTTLNKGGSTGKYVYPAFDNFRTGKHELFPIPLTELQSNAKLENRNNNGY